MSNIAQLEDFVRQGHYAQARNLAENLLTNGSDLRVRQLYALSLSKSGVPEAAMEVLRPVLDDQSDPETMGIMGSVYKEMFKKQQSTHYAVLARDTYEKNFQVTRNYYTGINAATMSMLAGQSRRGKEIATEVLNVLTDAQRDYWQAATEGEAYFLLKDRNKSQESYKRARAMAGTDWGKINSVHNQLWLLKHFLPVPPDLLKMFSPPVVVSFTGHMIDHPDRPTPRFPASIEAEIRRSIVSNVRAMNARIGYCSLACGADIIFAEVMEEEGGEVNLILPFRKEDFIESSVRFAGEEWVMRFNRLLSRHPVTYLTQEGYEGHPDLFSLTTSILFGLSGIRSASTHQEPVLLTVLSEQDMSRKTGGVRDTLAQWPYRKNMVTINPDIYVQGKGDSMSASQPKADVGDRPVLYLVCTNVIAETPSDEGEDHVNVSSVPPLVVDRREHYMISGFRSIFSAIEYCSMVQRATENPEDVRISMHVGPQRIHAGVVDQKLSGDLINALEVLHGITPPGAICATEMVSAILALEPMYYAFDYLDKLKVANNDRDLEVFRVRILKRL